MGKLKIYLHLLKDIYTSDNYLTAIAFASSPAGRTLH